MVAYLHETHQFLLGLALLAGLVAQASTTEAALIDGDLDSQIDDALNVIDDVGSPMNGLAFFDLSLSVGLNASDALAAAQSIDAAARFASPSEYDALFEAAGLSFSFLPSAGFSPGNALSDIDNNSNLLERGLAFAETIDILTGSPPSFYLADLWTDPDGLNDPSSTRDIITVSISVVDGVTVVTQQTQGTPPNGTTAWLLVSPAVVVPEPSSPLFSWVIFAAMGSRSGLRQRDRWAARCAPLAQVASS